MNRALRRQELAEIIEGLRQDEKMISPKYFYDERGSQLFEEITALPEYYPTETELGILRDNVDEIARLVGPQASLIEFGSGSSLKTRVLLENLHDLAAYVPVDISEELLLESAALLREDFPDIDILPVAADFTRPFALPQPAIMPVKNIVYFPGSTIGNFTNEDALELLRVMHGERAYNDSAGVTAEFNLNVLRHLNREFGADFKLDAFSHSAEYNPEEGRVELRLVSSEQQDVSVGDEAFSIEEDEAILTEYSHKYTLEGFARMAGHAGFDVDRVWTDAERLFSVQYCTRA
jgi:L-histidine Nalpha-methyltransferase